MSYGTDGTDGTDNSGKRPTGSSAAFTAAVIAGCAWVPSQSGASPRRVRPGSASWRSWASKAGAWATSLESDVMGLTAFTYKGLDRIVINTVLEEDSSPTGRRRMRSTLAHEVGHAVLHEDLFVEKLIFERNQGELFGALNRSAPSAIVCRNNDIFGAPQRTQWWEIQANKFMAAVLLPEPLFLQVVTALVAYDDKKARPHERVTRYYGTIDTISTTFNVSREMARIAVDKYLSSDRSQAGEDVLL